MLLSGVYYSLLYQIILSYAKTRSCVISASLCKLTEHQLWINFTEYSGGNNLKILAKLIFEFLRFIFRGKHDIILENLALRQQLVVQQRSIKRPKIKNRNRIFWIWLSRFWNNWRSSLIIVKAPSFLLLPAIISPFLSFSVRTSP